MPLSFNASLAVPELILAGSAMALLIWGAYARRTGALFIHAAVLALLAAAVAAAVGPVGRAFGGGLIADDWASFAKVAIFLASAVAVHPLCDQWFTRRGTQRFELSVLIVLAALGMSIMVSAGDLISLYVGIELHSLALYVLAAFQRDDAKSSEAGLKYFVLGALSSGLLLYGASLVYGFAGTVSFTGIAAATHGGANVGVLFGLIFLICGIGFKVSAAPFHMWTPDVYEGAPTPVVGFFAGAPKLAAMALFARLLTTAFPGATEQWRGVVLIIAILSVLVGAFAGLAQSNLKRLWAYSSIANIGYALIGLAAGGQAGVQSMLLFMVLYTIDVTGFFACLAALERGGKPMETFDDFAGLMRERPGLALALTAFALSALGLPPFSGFWAKFYVFKAALAAGPLTTWAAVAALIGSVVAAFYYLRLIKVMWLDPAPGPTEAPPGPTVAVAYATALFAFPAVMAALIFLDRWSAIAAAFAR
ncbi:MAG TPA: NADH-quinone oxidoreductase subunit NuoN [Caulobacteraceae bacterium]|jgi:NADH-quinone oxidoreductase subunit N